MVREEFCKECDQRHNCRKVYEQLGKTKGPSIVFKVILAFLVPLVVFIAALAIFGIVLDKVITRKEPLRICTFLLSLFVTVACMLIIKAINKHTDRSNKTKTS